MGNKSLTYFMLLFTMPGSWQCIHKCRYIIQEILESQIVDICIQSQLPYLSLRQDRLAQIDLEFIVIACQFGQGFIEISMHEFSRDIKRKKINNISEGKNI